MKHNKITIGTYLLEAPLGQGPHASVFLAKSLRFGLTGTATWALKILNPAESLDPEKRAQFIERISHHQRLTQAPHPRLVTCLECITDGQRPYALLEWVDGLSLDRILESQGKRGITRTAAQEALGQLVEALGAASERGLHHGHLHARDILIQADGQLKLTGFGSPDAFEEDKDAIAAFMAEWAPSWPDPIATWADSLAQNTWATMHEAAAAFPQKSRPSARARLGDYVAPQNPSEPQAGGARPEVDPEKAANQARYVSYLLGLVALGILIKTLLSD